jgi:hypothetical protein
MSVTLKFSGATSVYAVTSRLNSGLSCITTRSSNWGLKLEPKAKLENNFIVLWFQELNPGAINTGFDCFELHHRTWKAGPPVVNASWLR